MMLKELLDMEDFQMPLDMFCVVNSLWILFFLVHLLNSKISIIIASYFKFTISLNFNFLMVIVIIIAYETKELWSMNLI